MKVFKMAVIIAVLILTVRVTHVTETEVRVVTPDGNEWAYRAKSPNLKKGDKIIIAMSKEGEILNAW